MWGCRVAMTSPSRTKGPCGWVSGGPAPGTCPGASAAVTATPALLRSRTQHGRKEYHHCLIKRTHCILLMRHCYQTVGWCRKIDSYKNVLEWRPRAENLHTGSSEGASLSSQGSVTLVFYLLLSRLLHHQAQLHAKPATRKNSRCGESCKGFSPELGKPLTLLLTAHTVLQVRHNLCHTNPNAPLRPLTQLAAGAAGMAHTYIGGSAVHMISNHSF